MPSGIGFVGFVATTFAIAFIVTALLRVAERHVAGNPGSQEAPPAPPPLLERIAFDKRAALVSLTVEDHYFRIVTAKGEEIVLMRLADAMRETAPVKGMQVHRSHWVALNQVTAARRDGDRAILTMSNGTEVPVSRRYVPDIKAVGLLTG